MQDRVLDMILDVGERVERERARDLDGRLRAPALEYAGRWFDAINDGPRTALGLLGPWAPPVPSGGWLLHLPGGRSRFIATDRSLHEICADDPSWAGARRVAPNRMGGP